MPRTVRDGTTCLPCHISGLGCTSGAGVKLIAADSGGGIRGARTYHSAVNYELHGNCAVQKRGPSQGKLHPQTGG